MLAAQMTHAPHVVRMAGSDAGRLWHHPQFELLYDHVLRSAAAVVAVGAVAVNAPSSGVPPERIVPGGGFAVPEDLFTPEGPKLDIAALRAEAKADPAFSDLTWGNFAADRPYFGIYGKLGERKGSFALLAAMHRLMSAGVAEVGWSRSPRRRTDRTADFRAQDALDLTDRVLQSRSFRIGGCPVPARLPCRKRWSRTSRIVFHAPMIPREVLLQREPVWLPRPN